MKTILKYIIPTVISILVIPHIANAKTLSENTINELLIQMESPIEDMLDEINNKKSIALQFKKISTAMIELNQLNADRGIIDTLSKNIALQNSWFNLISIEVLESDDLSALTTIINQFSGQLIISTTFEHQYENTVAWMDYLGRELLYLSKYPTDIINTESLIIIRKADLNTTWNNIKKIIVGKQNSMALIKKVDPVINLLINETKAENVITLSKKELDLVDDIETYFHINQ